MSKIFVFGKSGQVARALKKALSDSAYFVGHDESHFENPQGLSELLDRYQPEIVINTAAYTAVDKAETEKDLCYLVNAEAPKKIAEWCKKNQALLIHFSTDYVYGGSGDSAQTEETSLKPVNVYGKSKKTGEEFVRQSGARHIILRTSWVYDEQGANFVRTMLRLGAEREELKIVNDQIGSPTYAGDLALAVKKIISLNPQNVHETYNLCGQGFISWYEFAKSIFSLAAELGYPLKIRSVISIPTTEYKTPAPRPLNSRMNQGKIKKDFGIEMPFWQDSLKECLLNMKNN
ncbi:MAG: dTDP-4-dehydrorhamnose reductase [Bdellovibrio sp.]